MNPIHEAWKATLRTLRTLRPSPAPAPAQAKPESPWSHVGKRGLR